MGNATTSRAARAGQNQSLYREVNERVKEMGSSFDPPLATGDWICECANDECFEHIELTHEGYEAIRAGEARFFVKPDNAHVFPEAENVVEQNERYWVVEKIGVAAAVARENDPRSPE
jgi:hypothetical protein